MRSILSVMSSDLAGVNPATLNGIFLYYRLMTKRSGLGDSTELYWVRLSQNLSEGQACTSSHHGYENTLYDLSRE
jgi:hypothetical protein